MDFVEANIYRTPHSQAIHRPVFEPPDIDIVGIWDSEKGVKWLEDLTKLIPDPGLRCVYLDLVLEIDALQEYISWVYKAGRAVAANGDFEKMRFYEGLVNALKDEFEAVTQEQLPVYSQVHQAEYMDVAEGRYGEAVRLDKGEVPFWLRRIIGVGNTSGLPSPSHSSHQSSADARHEDEEGASIETTSNDSDPVNSHSARETGGASTDHSARSSNSTARSTTALLPSMPSTRDSDTQPAAPISTRRRASSWCCFPCLPSFSGQARGGGEGGGEGG